MKLFKSILFSFVVIVGLALSASAQKNDQKRPPKGNPPVVTPPQDKTRPRENPPRDNGGDRRGGKKPGMVALVSGADPTLEIF